MMATDIPKKKSSFSLVALLGFMFALSAAVFDAWIRYPKLTESDIDWPLFGKQIVISHNRIGLVAVLAIVFSLFGLFKTTKGKMKGYTFAVAGLFLGLAFLFIFLYRNQIIFPLHLAEAH